MKTVEIEWPIRGLRKLNFFKYRDKEDTFFIGVCLFGFLFRIILRR